MQLAPEWWDLATSERLVVGAGGVGSAIRGPGPAPVLFTITTALGTSTRRVRQRRWSVSPGRPVRPCARRILDREHRRLRRDAKATSSSMRPTALQPADLRRGLRGSVHVRRHGDDALRAPPGAPTRADRRDARRPPVRRAAALARRRTARPGRHGGRARPLGRVRPLCRRPPLLAHRRGRRPGRRQPRRRGLCVRADLLDLDDDRGVPQPAADLGARAWLLHDRAVLRAGDVRLPGGHRSGRVRQRRARGGRARSRARSTASASPSSTASATSSSTSCARSISSGSTRRSRSRSAASRSLRATSWQLRSRIRRRSATA